MIMHISLKDQILHIISHKTSPPKDEEKGADSLAAGLRVGGGALSCLGRWVSDLGGEEGGASVGDDMRQHHGKRTVGFGMKLPTWLPWYWFPQPSSCLASLCSGLGDPETVASDVFRASRSPAVYTKRLHKHHHCPCVPAGSCWEEGWEAFAGCQIICWIRGVTGIFETQLFGKFSYRAQLHSKGFCSVFSWSWISMF